MSETGEMRDRRMVHEGIVKEDVAYEETALLLVMA